MLQHKHYYFNVNFTGHFPYIVKACLRINSERDEGAINLQIYISFMQTLIANVANANEGTSAAAKVLEGSLCFATVVASVGNVWGALGRVLFVT